MSDLYTLSEVLGMCQRKKMKILCFLDRYLEHVFENKLCPRKNINNVAEWTFLSSDG